MSVWRAGCILDSYPYRITSTKCLINTVVSSDNGHIVARNMYRLIDVLRNKHTKKIVHQFAFIYKIKQ